MSLQKSQNQEKCPTDVVSAITPDLAQKHLISIEWITNMKFSAFVMCALLNNCDLFIYE